jgi:hypothetical protein
VSTRYGEWVPDSLAPSGFRWKRHGEQPATSMLPIGAPHDEPEQLPADPDQDDLSEYDADPDLEIVPTEKLGPLDEVIIQPPQDPDWRPAGETA